MSDFVNEWYAPPGVTGCCAAGSICYIGYLEGGKTVLKFPLNNNNTEFILIEAQMFEALGSHPHILKYYGTNKYGLLLEYATNGSVNHYLKKVPTTSWKQRIIWCRELGEAIVHTHSRNILHVNISAANLLLDDKLRSKLADFQGCIKDPVTGSVLVTGDIEEAAKWHLPREPGINSEKSDLFAFGSTIYEIMNGDPPFPELRLCWDDEEIERRFKAGEFPSVQNLPGGDIILKCWLQTYENAAECLRDLRAVESQYSQVH